MEDIVRMLEKAGLDTAGGIACTGSMEKYKAALRRFADSCGENTAAIEELAASGDLRGYMIRVHALKSNAKTIGSHGLYAAFGALEQAALREDADFVAANTAGAVEACRALTGAVLPLIGGGAKPDAPAISAAEAAETAESLLAALDDFDDELSARLAERLTGYPFPEERRELLDSAARYIAEFMYDEAAAAVRELIPYIQPGAPD
ncbi:MAG: hypothetical protein K5876_04065 [Ruminiclostridium sp.]|nr:hypothetical protein [Ruminiclostridium sp.]